MRNGLKFSMLVTLMVALFFMQGLAGRGMIRVSENENGKTVYLETGDTFEVLLESNPTTGYQWAVDQLDQTILKQGKSEFVGASGGVGSVGNEVLRFQVVTKGKTLLRLVYQRPFEKAATPLKSFTLNLVVK